MLANQEVKSNQNLCKKVYSRQCIKKQSKHLMAMIIDLSKYNKKGHFGMYTKNKCTLKYLV